MRVRALARNLARGSAIAVVGTSMVLLTSAFANRESPGSSHEARADEAPSPPAPAGAGAACILEGTAPVQRDAKLHSAAAGGEVIGKFTGALLPMKMSELPAAPGSGRAKLHTSSGGPNLRIEGWVAPTAVPMFTKRDVAVVPGHIWIAKGQRVELQKSSPNKLFVSLSIAGSRKQKVKASDSCGAFALAPVPSPAQEVEGRARGYMMKRSDIELYDRPGGDVVFSLQMIEGAGLLFWSTKSKSGYVNVKARGDLSIDAWAKWGDLEALRPGEMMDRLIPAVRKITGAKLAMEDPPPIVKATEALTLRAKRDAAASSIGAIEVGAEVYVMETIAGWTNVLPRHLGITPPDGGGFWIPAGEAPKVDGD